MKHKNYTPPKRTEDWLGKVVYTGFSGNEFTRWIACKFDTLTEPLARIAILNSLRKSLDREWALPPAIKECDVRRRSAWGNECPPQSRADFVAGVAA